MALLVEPVINGVTHGSAIQAKKFSFDLRITNRGNAPTGAFTVLSLRMKSSEGQDIIETFGNRTFHVDVINPSEVKIIKIGDTAQSMHGLVNLHFRALPADTAITIEFLQKNPYTEEESIIGQNNWIDFFYIKSMNSHLQEKTNRWIMRLTWVTAIFTFIQILPILERIYEFLLS